MSDLTSIITVVRHGEKDENGKLTKNGFHQARSAGLEYQHLEGDVILFHSGVERVRETIKELSRFLGMNESELHDDIYEDGHLQDYISPYLHYLLDRDNKGDFYANWDYIEHTDENTRRRMSEFLMLNDQSSEPSVYFSPIDLFLRMKKLLRIQVELSGLTDSHYRTNFVNGTHEPNIMSFLYFFLKAENEQPAEFIERVGGSVNFAKGFTVRTFQDKEALNSLLTFRDIEKEFSLTD